LRLRAASKQASVFYKTNKYFHINKNYTGYHNTLSPTYCARKQALLNHSANACSCNLMYWEACAQFQKLGVVLEDSESNF
jgi:hypothetical protein